MYIFHCVRKKDYDLNAAFYGEASVQNAALSIARISIPTILSPRISRMTRKTVCCF